MQRLSLLVIIFLIAAASPVWAVSLDYELVAESSQLQLYINPETAEIAVVEVADGTVWYSNPPNRDREETVARGASKNALGAQLLLTYFTQIGAEVTLDSYNESAVFDQIEIHPIENGIRVEYTIGQEWTDDAFVPNLMTKARFEEEILSRASEKQRETLLDLYTMIWFEEAPEDYQRVSVTQVNKERLLGSLTLMADEKALARRNAKRDLYNNLFDHIVARTDVSRRSDITPEIMEIFTSQPLYMLGTRVSRWDREEIAEIMRDIGFTPYDRAVDLEYFGFPELLPNHRVFHVAIEYQLDEGDLVVRIPVRDIEYPVDAINPEDQEAPPVTLPVYSVSLLPHFGAAGRDDDGYLFVPDGPGALIYLNNGKTTAPVANILVYGRDGAINRDEQLRLLVESVMPVFGMKKGDRGFFAVIEQGDAMARIKADVAGRSISYNVVYPEFILMPKGTATLQTTDQFTREVTIAVPQSRPIIDDVIVRYTFLSGEEASYVGMAHLYQKYLRSQGLGARRSVRPTRFYLDLIGAIQVKRPVLGIPQTIMRPLTTFEQAQEILEKLQKAGLEGITVRYRGWLKGGLDHEYPSRVKWERSVGGREGFLQLQEYAASSQIGLYPDVDFLTVANNKLFDGFIAQRDGGRLLDRTMAKLYEYDRATFQAVKDRYRHILSPGRLSTLLDSFLVDYASLGHDSISLGDMGSELYSDFRYNPDKLIDREQAKNIIREQFKKLSDYDIMVEKGFAYSLPYAAHVINLPSYGNGYRLIDEYVPFAQIVLRGYVSYSGEPINFAHDHTFSILRTIELGAAPYYVWSWASSSATKHTDYDYMYALHYKDWFEEAVSLYKELEPFFELTEGQRIVDHTRPEPDLAVTTYENNVMVLVNYSTTEKEFAGVSVPPLGYALVERGN